MDTVDPQNLQTLAESVLAVALLVVLALGVGLGLAVWLLGWKLARPACVVSGLVLGGLGGFTLGELLRSEGAFTIPLVIGAAIAGGLIAALLFRIWMALSGAALLALAIPAAVLIWQGTPSEVDELEPPAAEQSTDRSRTAPRVTPPRESITAPRDERGRSMNWDDISEAMRKRLEAEAARRASGDGEQRAVDADASEDVADEPAESAQLNAALDEARQAARSWYSQTKAQLAAWWNDLDGAARRTLFTAAGVGALVGLVLGLIMPYTAAAVQSALVGGLLMLLAGRTLVERAAPDWTGYFPHTPRATLLCLGLITLLGVLLQWTFFHKRADK
ncbi:MAG: hypothetical protein ACODAQ_04890 [Phycisphaeraceae bacterium]